jgi:hypothetical protein
MKGEKIYEYDLNITGVTDYGVSLESILSSKEKIPPQGARFDVAFEGNATGRLSGRVRGVDYLRMRADGRIDLDIRGTIETDDGFRIGLSADGAAVMRQGEPRCGAGTSRPALSRAAESWHFTVQPFGPGTDFLRVGQHGPDLGAGDRQPGCRQDSHRRIPAIIRTGRQ